MPNNSWFNNRSKHGHKITSIFKANLEVFSRQIKRSSTLKVNKSFHFTIFLLFIKRKVKNYCDHDIEKADFSTIVERPFVVKNSRASLAQQQQQQLHQHQHRTQFKLRHRPQPFLGVRRGLLLRHNVQLPRYSSRNDA